MEQKQLWGRIRKPSVGAIVWVVVLEVLFQTGWWLMGKMIAVQMVKDIGILVMFLAAMFALGWYVLKPVFATQQTKVTDDMPAYLPDLIKDQKHRPQDFLYPRLVKTFPSASPTELGIVVEWFNGSVFDMKFESINGEIRMGEIKSDPASLGHQLKLVNEPTLSACRSCTCTLYVQVVNGQATDLFRDALAKGRALIWGLNLTWKVRVDQLNRAISVQQAPADSITVVPTNS